MSVPASGVRLRLGHLVRVQPGSRSHLQAPSAPRTAPRQLPIPISLSRSLSPTKLSAFKDRSRLQSLPVASVRSSAASPELGLLPAPCPPQEGLRLLPPHDWASAAPPRLPTVTPASSLSHPNSPRLLGGPPASFPWLQNINLGFHFEVERQVNGVFINFFRFNGIAGVWRIKALEDARGWMERTTVEGIDVAVRAHLKGWKFHLPQRCGVPKRITRVIRGLQEAAVPMAFRSHADV